MAEVHCTMLCLLVAMTLSWSARASDVRQAKYKRISGMDGMQLTSAALFKTSARSALHCGMQCSRLDGCSSYTYIADQPSSCRGYDVVMTSQNALDGAVPAAGGKTFQNIIARAKPTSCVDSRSSSPVSGVVTIYPDNVTAVEVYCDQDTDGGGWAVFQRRQDGSLDFYRNWTDYQNLFGDLNGEFWIGLDALHTLTSSQPQELRVDLTLWNLTRVSASYNGFNISDGDDNYRLNIASFLGGTAGDSLSFNHWKQFTTNDADHDLYGGLNCAQHRHGAWWYWACGQSNLNGQYKPSSSAPNRDGIIWSSAGGSRYSMKATEMKLRPR